MWFIIQLKKGKHHNFLQLLRFTFCPPSLFCFARPLSKFDLELRAVTPMSNVTDLMSSSWLTPLTMCNVCRSATRAYEILLSAWLQELVYETKEYTCNLFTCQCKHLSRTHHRFVRNMEKIVS